jgi:hypothetical protein
VVVTNRRAFLATLAAALVLDPERALWVPGKKLISLGRPPFIEHNQLFVDWAHGFDRASALTYCLGPPIQIWPLDAFWNGVREVSPYAGKFPPPPLGVDFRAPIRPGARRRDHAPATQRRRRLPCVGAQARQICTKTLQFHLKHATESPALCNETDRL